MSYAIIRNQNYKKSNLAGLYKHNERKNTNYSNKDIDKSYSNRNYSIKKCNTTYTKALDYLIEKYQLQGRIIKTTNVMCEFVVTSDKEFFETIGTAETERYFKTAYKFVSNYQNLGEDFIISAKVHLDESTPHLHIIFVPVIHTIDKNNNVIHKISCSTYWKGKDSYRNLQEHFYSYMIKSGFDLERGNTKDNKHIQIEQLKKFTDYEMQKFEKTQNKSYEKTKEFTNIEELQIEHKRLIRKFNTLANQYTKIRTNVSSIETRNTTLEVENLNLIQENIELDKENEKLEKEIDYLKSYIEHIYIVVENLFDFPIQRLKSLVKNFIEKLHK